MARDSVKPTIRKKSLGTCDPHDVFEHSAFGVVHLSHLMGGGNSLFGSDVPHMSCMRISVSRAELHRSLSRDWIFSDNTPLIEFDLSHAQFAEFITGSGNGSGTPVTLRYVRAGDVESLPKIERIESKMDTFRAEVRDMSARALADMKSEVKRLSDLIDSGKLPKKELREIAENLTRRVSQAPGSMEFVVSSAEEALEKATVIAKIEVEAFVSAKAHSLGLDSIQQLARLEHKTPEV